MVTDMAMPANKLRVSNFLRNCDGAQAIRARTRSVMSRPARAILRNSTGAENAVKNGTRKRPVQLLVKLEVRGTCGVCK